MMPDYEVDGDPDGDELDDMQAVVGNPKDLIGCTKVPMHLWPTAATVYGAIALCNGARKYGRANWRATPVRASIYFDACSRHLAAWFEGQEADEEGVPHLGAALACIAIVIDAGICGKLIDDRNFNGSRHPHLMAGANTEVPRLRELHRDRPLPKDWTIQENHRGVAIPASSPTPQASPPGGPAQSIWGRISKGLGPLFTYRGSM